MTEGWRRQAGLLLRNCRESIFAPSGKPTTQKELAHEAAVSERTVQRLEAGERVRDDSTLAVLEALRQMELDPEKLWQLESAFNPIRLDSCYPLDNEERSRIRGEIRTYMREISRPLPGFVMDEYWFVRAINVYLLALHQIEPRMLYMPEVWHVVGVKFEPELRMQQLRGPKWKDYYLALVKDLRRRLALYEGMERHQRLIQWLMGLEGFKSFWDRAKREPHLDYALRVLTSRAIPVDLGFEVQWWNELGTDALISPVLPPYWRSIWVPSAHSADRELTEVLQDAALTEAAERLGYDVRKLPIHFIEDYISEDDLRKIGGWIE